MISRIQLASLTRSKTLLVGLTVVFSALAGVTSGYILATKKLETKYDEISKKEIAEAKQFYSLLHKTDDFETPESAVESLGLTEAAEALQKYQGVIDNRDLTVTQAKEIVDDFVSDEEVRVIENIQLESVSIDTITEPHNGPIEIVEHNIFKDQDKIEFNYEEELANRIPNEPYVISHDEFMESEPGYNQVTLTWFEGDDVLTDEKDEPIIEIESTVGTDNLLRFGHGSKDNRIVYIRNDRLDLDFEVVQSQGKYVEEILGFLEHNDRRPKIRRFRGEDG